MRRDLLLATRTLRRSPGFTLVAVLSLALGIGATTAIYSLTQQVLLSSLPVKDPASLVLLHRDLSLNGRDSSDDFESVFSYPMYRDLRDHDAAFAGQIIARATSRVALLYRGDTKPASAEIVSGNFFTTLQVSSALGRVLTPADDMLQAHPVAVLGHAFWITRFGGDPRILNQTLGINGQPVQVIGVAPPAFIGLMPGVAPDLYVPVSLQRIVKPTWDVLEDPMTRWLNLFARLKPGETLTQAKAATDVSYRSILESELARKPDVARPGARGRQEFLTHRLTLLPAAQGINQLRREWEKPLLAILAMVVLVLLITCTNVASLLLTRAAGLERDVSIRLALGASRLIVAKQLAIEAILLAAAGAALGLFFAWIGLKALLLLLPEGFGEGWLKAGLNWSLLGFSVALAVACCVVFGLIPALQSTRADVISALKNNSKQIAGGGAWLRKIMVTAQVALSLVLLTGACLFSESFYSLLKVHIGFKPERLLTFSVNASQVRPQTASSIAFYRELEDRLAGLPGVLGAGAANSGPFSGDNTGGNVTVEGYRAGSDQDLNVQFGAVGPGFFHALGIPLRAGREFTPADNAASPKVIVVNEAFLRRFFRDRKALGYRVLFGASNTRKPNQLIVGVVNDIRKDLREATEPTIFYPYAQWERPEGLQYYVRTAGDERGLISAIRKLVRQLDPGVPLDDPKPMTLLIRNSIYSDRLLAFLAGAFAVLATALAAVGLYGVVAYVVTRRTSEIGVRMALGAIPADILRMILLEAAGMVGLGICAGLAAAFILGRLVESQLYGVSPTDPAVVVFTLLMLVIVTAGAALVPAIRASRLDPVTALNYE